ncbi:MAG: hypothetical protein U1A28_04570, partial [Patescibacteria group bacterium]|nr:hypothetical protein [Patescibacteria group bacterium]
LTLRLRRDDQNSDTHKKLLEKIANNFYPIDEDFLRNRGARPSVVFDNLATDVLIRVQLMGNKKIPPKGILRLIKYTSIQEDIYDDLGPLYDTGMDGDEIVNDGVFSKKISVKESGPKPLFFGFILVVPDSMVPTRLHDLLLPVAIRQDPECVVDSFVADLRSGDIESAGKKVGERVKEGLSTIDQSALLKLADSIERRTLEEPKEDSAKWYRSDSRSYEIPWDDADGPGSLSISLFRDALGIWSIQF